MKTNPHNHKPMNKQGSDTTFDPHKPRIIRKNCHVTSQTAYHITQMAIACNTSEGRIIDKLMRNFLAAQGPSSKYD